MYQGQIFYSRYVWSIFVISAEFTIMKTNPLSDIVTTHFIVGDWSELIQFHVYPLFWHKYEDYGICVLVFFKLLMLSSLLISIKQSVGFIFASCMVSFENMKNDA